MEDIRFTTAFPYEPPPGQPGGVARPQLWIRLHHRGATTRPFLALVDSGADVSAFHLSVANRLGIDLDQCRPTSLRGVGGTVSGYSCEVDIEVVDRRFLAEVRFVPSVVALLGRHDVFMQFKFAFDQRAQTLFVEPY